MKLANGNGDIGINLLKALRIDHLCVSSLDMLVTANKPVEITVKFFVTEEALGGISEKVTVYNLASWDLVRFCQTGNGYL